MALDLPRIGVAGSARSRRVYSWVVSLVVPQQSKPTSVDPLARQQSRCRTKIGCIELAGSSPFDSLVDHLQKSGRRNVGRGGNATGDDVLFHFLVIGVIDIGAAPAIRAHDLEILGVRIDDGVPVQFYAQVGQLPCCLLRAREVEELVVPTQKRCQMGEDRDLLLTVGVMRNGGAVHEDDIAIVDAEIAVQYAPDNAMART